MQCILTASAPFACRYGETAISSKQVDSCTLTLLAAQEWHTVYVAVKSVKEALRMIKLFKELEKEYPFHRFIIE